MNPIYGLLIFVLATVITAIIRGMYISKFIRRNAVSQYTLVNSYGCYIGPFIYIISIFFIALGPLSFKIVNIDFMEYIMLNIISGVGYGLTYPPFAPISNSGYIYVIRDGEKFTAYVGKFMGRKFRVISMPTADNPTMVVMRVRGRCEFEVTVAQD